MYILADTHVQTATDDTGHCIHMCVHVNPQGTMQTCVLRSMSVCMWVTYQHQVPLNASADLYGEGRMAWPCPLSLAAAPKPASLTSCLMAAGLLAAFRPESASCPPLLNSCAHQRTVSGKVLHDCANQTSEATGVSTATEQNTTREMCKWLHCMFRRPGNAR